MEAGSVLPDGRMGSRSRPVIRLIRQHSHSSVIVNSSPSASSTNRTRYRRFVGSLQGVAHPSLRSCAKLATMSRGTHACGGTTLVIGLFVLAVAAVISRPSRAAGAALLVQPDTGVVRRIDSYLRPFDSAGELSRSALVAKRDGSL